MRKNIIIFLINMIIAIFSLFWFGINLVFAINKGQAYKADAEFLEPFFGAVILVSLIGFFCFQRFLLKKSGLSLKKYILINSLFYFAAIFIGIYYTLESYSLSKVDYEYWKWLGRPNPVGMLFIDNYPGHDHTAKYRHEDYFVDLPDLWESFENVISEYGQPLEMLELESNEGYVRLLAVYEDFELNIFSSNNGESYKVSSIFVTEPSISLTGDNVKIGMTKEEIEHIYRYYRKINQENLKEGYHLGYIDGSMLSGQTFVEFMFDEYDILSRIYIYNPH